MKVAVLSSLVSIDWFKKRYDVVITSDNKKSVDPIKMSVKLCLLTLRFLNEAIIIMKLIVMR